MNRRLAVREQERLFGPTASLPEICLSVRAGVNGSAEPWPESSVEETLAMLRARLATWQEGWPREAAVDEAVRRLVAATIAEVEAYRQS